MNKLKQIKNEIDLIITSIEYLDCEKEKLEDQLDYWILEKCKLLCMAEIKRRYEDA